LGPETVSVLGIGVCFGFGYDRVLRLGPDF
jgi:hypothetical protein